MDTSKPIINQGDALARHRTGVLVPYQRPVRPAALEAAPDGMALLTSLRRRWVLALCSGLVIASTTGPAAYFLIPRAKYTASSTLYISMNPRRIFFDPRDGGADSKTYQRTQVALMTNRHVLSHALSDPGVAGLPTVQDLQRRRVDPEEWLGTNLKATFANASEVLEVSLSGDNPRDVQVIVNQVIDSYMTLVVDEERKERLNRLDSLQKLWGKYQEELKNKRKTLKELVKSVGSNDPTGVAVAQQFKSAQLTLIQAEQVRTQGELRKLQADLAVLGNPAAPDDRAAPPPPAPAAEAAALDRRVEMNSDVAGHRSRLEAMARKYADSSRRSRNQADPAVRKALAEWQAANAQLAGARARVRADLEGGGDAGRPGPPDGGARQLARLRAQAQVLEGYRDALAKDADRLQADLQGLSRGGLDLETERDEINIATEFARKVGAEVEAVRVELQAPDRIRLLAKAKEPRAKDESRRLKAGAATASGSLALALLAVSFCEFRARRVDTPDEVTNGLGLNLVGALPALPNRAGAGGPGGPAARRWQSLLVESIDATRTVLLHASRAASIRVVMVTSAAKGEGKTSLSCHLAASLSRAGRKTLLVDCDLRNPSVHRVLDMRRGPGLSELLRGEGDAGAVIQKTPDDGLDFLAAGDCDVRTQQALAQGDLQTLLAALKGRYDFIIVDTAPILPVVDSLLISQAVDGVILSVLREVSRLPQVYSAYERLNGLGAHILGAVVAGVRPNTFASQPYAYSQDDA